MTRVNAAFPKRKIGYVCISEKPSERRTAVLAHMPSAMKNDKGKLRIALSHFSASAHDETYTHNRLANLKRLPHVSMLETRKYDNIKGDPSFHSGRKRLRNLRVPDGSDEYYTAPTETHEKLESELKTHDKAVSRRNEAEEAIRAGRRTPASRNMPRSAPPKTNGSSLDLQDPTLVESERSKDREIQNLRTQLKQMELSAKLAAAAEQAEKKQSRKTGLRGMMFHDEWHWENPGAAHELWGMGDWAETKAMMFIAFETVEDTSRPKPLREPFTLFEKLLICRLHHRRALTMRTMALLIGRGKSTIAGICKEYSSWWGAAGQALSLLPCSAHFMEAVYPEVYTEMDLHKIGLLVDGKDFLCETSRESSPLTRALYSNKMEASAFRSLTYTLPNGLTVYHTELFGARLTEERLLALHAHNLAWLPALWRILADKGFAKTAGLYPNNNQQVVPHMLHHRHGLGKQFWESELQSDQTIKTLRYTSEAFYAGIVGDRVLSDVVKREHWSILNDALHWAHALGNFRAGFHMPASAT